MNSSEAPKNQGEPSAASWQFPGKAHQGRSRCKAEAAYLTKFIECFNDILPLWIAIEDRDSRREVDKIRQQVEKNNNEKIRLLEEIKGLHKQRKQLSARHLWQCKVATRFKNQSVQYRSDLTNLDFVYDFVGLCDGSNFGKVEKYTEGTLDGELRVARGMHEALGTLMRKNRELYMKVVHEEKERDSCQKKLGFLFRQIAAHLKRSNFGNSDDPAKKSKAAHAEEADGGVRQGARRGAGAGAILNQQLTITETTGTTQALETACELEGVYNPLSPAWNDDGDWQANPHEKKVSKEFMGFLVAAQGRYPFDFVSDLRKSDQDRAIEALSYEIVAHAVRCNSMEDTFQKIQQIRFVPNIQQTIKFCNKTLTELLYCERAAIWIVDDARGVLWTKSNHDEEQFVVTMFDNTAERGSSLLHCRSSVAPRGFLGTAVRTKMVVTSNDALHDVRRNDELDMEFGCPTRTIACVPIFNGVRPVAVMEAVNKEWSDEGHQGFSERDIFIMSVLGHKISDTLRDFMKDELGQMMDKRKDALISAIGELYLHCTSMSDLLQLLDVYLKDMFCAHKASIILLYGDHVTRLEVDKADKGNVSEAAEAPRDHGLMGCCLLKKLPVHAPHFLRDSRYDPTIDLPGDPDRDAECSLHCWPLYRGRLLSAIVQFISPTPSLVDFGDAGTFSHVNPSHSQLLQKMMVLVANYVERWYPAMERLQSESGRKLKKITKTVMALGGFKKIPPSPRPDDTADEHGRGQAQEGDEVKKPTTPKKVDEGEAAKNAAKSSSPPKGGPCSPRSRTSPSSPRSRTSGRRSGKDQK